MSQSEEKLKKQLEKISQINDQERCADALADFFKANCELLPPPGKSHEFDLAMWQASEYMSLSTSEQDAVSRVTSKLLAKKEDAEVIDFRKLTSQAMKEILGQWEKLVGEFSWNPSPALAFATRAVSAHPTISLGTYKSNLADIDLQINLGWIVDKSQLKVIMQALGSDSQAVSNVEFMVRDQDNVIVYSRKTNDDGAVVAPEIKLPSGQYQIEISFEQQVLKMPKFQI